MHSKTNHKALFLWSFATLIFVHAFLVHGEAEATDQCDLPEGFWEVTGVQGVEGGSVHYQVTPSGCSGGGSYMCDLRACCQCYVEQSVTVHVDGADPLVVAGEGFDCSSWFPEVTVDAAAGRVVVAHTGASRSFLLDGGAPVARTDEEVDDPVDSAAERDFDGTWLVGRRSHVAYVGRIGAACSMEEATKNLRRILDLIEEVRRGERPERDGAVLLATELLGRSCALTSREMMTDPGVDHPLSGMEHWFELFPRLERERKERIRDQLLEVASFGASLGYDRVALPWIDGLLTHEPEEAAELLARAGHLELAQVFAEGGAPRPLPVSSHTFAAWTAEYLADGEFLLATGAYNLAIAADGEHQAEFTSDERRELDEVVFYHLYRALDEAGSAGDTQRVVALLWLLDDWLISRRQRDFASRATFDISPNHSQLPYGEPRTVGAPRDGFIRLGTLLLRENDENVTALLAIASLAFEAGRRQWAWTQAFEEGGQPLIRTRNTMPVVRAWLDEVLRVRPDHHEAHRQLGEWFLHRSEWERGFSGQEMARRILERVEAEELGELSCDPRQERFDALRQEVTEALIAEQTARRDDFQRRARESLQRSGELRGDDEEDQEQEGIRGVP